MNGPNWKGGKPKTSTGYILQYSPKHKFASVEGYVPKHRLIWEIYHKACLLKWSNVHHINHVRDDNRIENLEAMTSWKHTYDHKKQDFTNRFCYNCNGKTQILNGRENWFKHPIIKQVYLCRKCYRKKTLLI